MPRSGLGLSSAAWWCPTGLPQWQSDDRAHMDMRAGETVCNPFFQLNASGRRCVPCGGEGARRPCTDTSAPLLLPQHAFSCRVRLQSMHTRALLVVREATKRMHVCLQVGSRSAHQALTSTATAAAWRQQNRQRHRRRRSTAAGCGSRRAPTPAAHRSAPLCQRTGAAARRLTGPTCA